MNLISSVTSEFTPVQPEASSKRPGYPVYFSNVLAAKFYESLRQFRRRMEDYVYDYERCGYLEYNEKVVEIIIGFRDVLFVHEIWKESEMCHYLHVATNKFHTGTLDFFEFSLGNKKDILYIDRPSQCIWIKAYPFTESFRAHLIDENGSLIPRPSLSWHLEHLQGYHYGFNREGKPSRMTSMSDYDSSFVLMLYFDSPIPPEFEEESIFAKEGLYWRN